MKKTVKTILIAACVVATFAAMLLLTGCNPDSPAIITPSDSTPTKPTVAVPASQMTLNDVMAINDDEMPWSRLSVFEHTMNDDGTIAKVDVKGTDSAMDTSFVGMCQNEAYVDYLTRSIRWRMENEVIRDV